MRKAILSVALVLGVQGFAFPAAATDRPPMAERSSSEMSQTTMEKMPIDASAKPTRLAEMSEEKTVDRQVADDPKESGRAKQIHVYFFFGGR